MYRIEIWCNKSAPAEELKKLKETLKKLLGSEVTEKAME
jgi:hypothetical protein